MRNSKLFILLSILFILGCSGINNSREFTKDSLDQISQINLELASRYFQGNEFVLAEEKLNKSIKANPKNVQSQNLMGVIYSKQGKLKDAETFFNRALKLDNNHIYTLNNYGQFLCQMKRYEKGEGYLYKALRSNNPTMQATVYYNIAKCRIDQDRRESAEIYFKKVLEISPSHSATLIELTQIKFHKERWKEASEYLKKFNQIADHNSQSLWLGYLIGLKTYDQNLSDTSALILKKKFPASKEANLLKNNY